MVTKSVQLELRENWYTAPLLKGVKHDHNGDINEHSIINKTGLYNPCNILYDRQASANGQEVRAGRGFTHVQGSKTAKHAGFFCFVD